MRTCLLLDNTLASSHSATASTNTDKFSLTKTLAGLGLQVESWKSGRDTSHVVCVNKIYTFKTRLDKFMDGEVCWD